MPSTRICLVLTRHNRNSLAALAGALEVSPETALLPVTVLRVDRDPRADEHLGAGVAELLGRGDRLVVAFSFMTYDVIETARLIREVARACGRFPAVPGGDPRSTGPGLVLVGGGPHPSGAPAESLRLGLDYVIRGEGEVAFPAFAAAVANGLDPLLVKGTAALRDGRLEATGLAPRAELDRFPAAGSLSGVFSHVEISRGCPAVCRFCQTSYLFGAKFRHRSAEAIERSVALLVEKGCTEIRFVAADAFAWGAESLGDPNPDALDDLLVRLGRVLKGRRLFFGSFPAEAWPCSVDERMLSVVKARATNDNIVMGAQSGSQRTLDRMHRPHRVEDATRAAEMILSFGYKANVDFVFGFPGEDLDDEAATLRLVLELARKGATIHAHSFIPLAGTPLAGAPPPKLSRRTVKVLQHLSGTRRQFGKWRAQWARTRAVFRFRQAMTETGDPDRALEAAAEIRGHNT